MLVDEGEEQNDAKLAPFDEVMRSDLLRWFGHIQRRDVKSVPRRVVCLTIPGTRRRWRPNNTLHQHIKEVTMGLYVTKDMAVDQKECRRRTRPTLGDRENVTNVSEAR